MERLEIHMESSLFIHIEDTYMPIEISTFFEP
jgi:hypothetical protein